MMLNWRKTRALLARYKIPLITSPVVTKKTEVDSFLAHHKRIVLKLYSPKASHKTEQHLVFTDLCSKQEVHRAFLALVLSQKKFGGDIVCQPHLDGIELIIGGIDDATFGPVVMAGSGGIYAESLHDVAFRLAPLSVSQSKQLVKRTRAYALVTSARNKQLDANTLYEALSRVSQLIAGERIAELDINPFVVSKNGAFALDARIIMKEDQAR
ncbi:hypothetical protein COT72_02955 [archaeon CG10_big_fil_rev_8_21_14_0_10_43_11]|nr:MAG: hypothetical protein COT72_02955 [archaeon CG10_big_fil_rev_8_21_14_0_10_43_11]